MPDSITWDVRDLDAYELEDLTAVRQAMVSARPHVGNGKSGQIGAAYIARRLAVQALDAAIARKHRNGAQ